MVQEGNSKVAILYAGEQQSDGLALIIKGMLLQRGIETEEYNSLDEIEENSYKDKLNDYIETITRSDKVIVILSRKYLCESIYCQEEIKELMGRHKNQFRGNVYVISSNEEIFDEIYDEFKCKLLLKDFFKLIDDYLKSDGNALLSDNRRRAVEYYKNSTQEFIKELRLKRNFMYKHNQCELLVKDLIESLNNNYSDVPPYNFKYDENKFLSYFYSCSPKDASSKYCELLELESRDANILNISRLYRSCMSPTVKNFLQFIQNKEDLKPFNSTCLHFDSYIMKEFMENHYVAPEVAFRHIDINGDIGQSIYIPKDAVYNDIFTNLYDGKLVFLKGDIGKGKTTFIYKLIYELSSKNSLGNAKIIYKQLTNELNETVESVYNGIIEKLDNKNDNILIIDNLDSFSFDHERFMFTESGYFDFQGEIDKIRNLVHRLRTLMNEDRIKSILFAVRPYVLTHFIHDNTMQNNQFSRTCIYSLIHDDNAAEKIVISRLNLFRKMLNILIDDKNLKCERKKIFEEHSKKILDLLDDITYETYSDGSIKKHYVEIKKYGQTSYIEKKVFRKHPTINHLLQITTQGFRTIVKLFSDLGYNDKLFENYFNNNIILLYTLGMYKKYSQILPLKCKRLRNNYSGKKYNYPNMFLAVASSEANKKLSCAKPHKVTYWLKIFILHLVNTEKNITISKILNKLSLYDISLVKVALGSLGTVNEYNCIEYTFPLTPNIDYTDFINGTTAKLTTRGKYIVENNFYLNYNNLEFFIEDWQLPKPRIDKIFKNQNQDSENFINELHDLLKFLDKSNYQHLVKQENSNFDFNRYINNKTRVIIWFTYILEAAFEYEIKTYDIDFLDYNEMKFDERRISIIDDAIKILDKSRNSDFKRSLEEFKGKCAKYYPYIQDYFREIDNEDIRVTCVDCHN